MKTLSALVHKDDDSGFGVQFPDAPGCFSAADTLVDVLPNAAEALSLYFEDAPVPRPLRRVLGSRPRPPTTCATAPSSSPCR